MEAERGAHRHPEVERWSTDALLLISYTITALQRVGVKRFNPIHRESLEMLASPRQRHIHYADGHTTTTTNVHETVCVRVWVFIYALYRTQQVK